MSATQVTIVNGDVVVVAAADVSDDAVWVAPADLQRSSGWELKPQGLCRGPVCMPVPEAQRAKLARADGHVNLIAFARYRGQPVVHDDSGQVWVFGQPAETRSHVADTLEAPDFALPDLAGKTHRLSDARGKKVLIASWASW